MPRYAAFLRGINVGGTRVKADALCAPFSALGLENVTTFRASGNVIFDSPRRSAARLAADIETRLASDLGFTRAVTFIRTAAELRALAASDPLPFPSEGKLQVMFLQRKPDDEVLRHATEEDRLALGERELFWLPSGGMAQSELDLQAIERLIGPTTTRTMGTIGEIARRYFT